MKSPEEHLIVALHHLKVLETETEPSERKDKIHNMVTECKCLIKEYREKAE